MLLPSLLLALSVAHAASCPAVRSIALVSDLSCAAYTAWSEQVDNAMDFLTDGLKPASAKYESHEVADDVREALARGELTSDDAARLLDALGFIWHRADDLEEAWKALKAGNYDEAKDLAHALADRIRQARDGGWITQEQAQKLLDMAGALWGIADSLDKGDKASAVSKAKTSYGKGLISGDQLKMVDGTSVSTGGGSSSTQPSPAASVPYFSQYDNGINPGGSCQNTSVAMLLNYYGVKVTPDQISSRFGTSYAQDPAGLADVFNTYAREAGIDERLKAHTDGYMSDFNALLDKGDPVIVHGYFTGYGHVMVATDRDSTGYTVNDPAGVWSQRFKGGYQGSYNGQNAHYGTSAFTSAVATYDGYTQTTLWYHEVVRP